MNEQAQCANLQTKTARYASSVYKKSDELRATAKNTVISVWTHSGCPFFKEALDVTRMHLRFVPLATSLAMECIKYTHLPYAKRVYIGTQYLLSTFPNYSVGKRPAFGCSAVFSNSKIVGAINFHQFSSLVNNR